MAALISEDKSEMVDSIQNNFNSLSTKVETQTLKEKTYYGMGKRKRAKAWVQIKAGKGIITINGRPFINYFNNSYIRGKILLPLQLTDTIAQLDLNIKVLGGGFTGQTEAIIPAISKALIQINPQWRPELAKYLCLTHDPRNVEPKKPGRIKARKGYVYNRR
jgi:small subunit ribosomal protein S9